MTEHIIKRLEELGEEQVRRLYSIAGLPSNWNPHIIEWLTSKAKKNEEADKAKPQDGA